MQPLDDWRPGTAAAATAELRASLPRARPHELTVPVAPRASLAERFHARHRERYGFDDPDGEIEVVSVRVSRVTAGPALELPRVAADGAGARPGVGRARRATMWVGDGWTARRRPDGSWRMAR